MKIIQGKQAVVTQIETTTAVAGKAAEAVCRSPRSPVYQQLHYHGVQKAEEQIPFMGEPDQKDADTASPALAETGAVDTAFPAMAEAGELDTVSPVIRDRHPGVVQREMTLRDLFGKDME